MLIRNCEPQQACITSSCKVLNTLINHFSYKISFRFTNQLLWKEQKNLCWCAYSIGSFYYLIYQGFTVSAVSGQEIFSPTHWPSLQPLVSMGSSSRNRDDTTPASKLRARYKPDRHPQRRRDHLPSLWQFMYSRKANSERQ